MLSVTDTTFNLLVLKLVLHGNLSILVFALLLIFAPIRAGSEYDILSYARGIAGWLYFLC